MKRSDLIQIRPYDPKADANFIFATCLHNLWFSAENKTTLGKDTFYRIHHGRLENILSPETVSVACLKEDSDTILGYVIRSEIPFVYLKKAWRDPKLGLSNLLKGTK